LWTPRPQAHPNKVRNFLLIAIMELGMILKKKGWTPIWRTGSQPVGKSNTILRRKGEALHDKA